MRKELPETCLIPAGPFLMGSDHGKENEVPVHIVWVDAFAINRYPVTRQQYALFLNETRHPPPPFWEEPEFQIPEQPVVGVNWFEAVAYCNWMSTTTGALFRLPTEAEREKAARGGLEGFDYPWGNELPADHLGGRTAPLEPVGSEGPNGYGIYNLSAGVHEWCADYYSPTFYRVSPERNPCGPDAGDRRVARGGSWRHGVRYARCSARSALAPDKQFNDFGFRCVLTLT